MENLIIVRAFELVCLVTWIFGVLWVYRGRNPIEAGLLAGSSTLFVFDWIFNSNWFFRVVYAPEFIALWRIEGVVQPLALAANYAVYFGLPTLLFLRRREALDRRLGGASYLVIFLGGAALDGLFEIPMVRLGLWRYYQAPRFLLGGVPWSNLWYSGLLTVAAYAAARLATSWSARMPAPPTPSRQDFWSRFAMGVAAMWSAFYLSLMLQLAWYGATQPWIAGPRAF